MVITPEIRENRKKWLEALRSNKYKQGQSRLKSIDFLSREERYCCLGVWCDVSGKGSWETDGHLSCKFKVNDSEEYEGHELIHYLSSDMLAGIGISYNLQYTLANKNDSLSQQLTFPEIADYLENIWANDDEESSHA